MTEIKDIADEKQQDFIREQIGTDFDISVLANDASYRCYYRVTWQGQSRVVMDAPPEKESVDAFVIIAHALRDAQVMVPEIYAQAREQGFLLLSDFGDELYFKHLSLETADHLYTQAFNSILSIQACVEVKNYDLPQTFTCWLDFMDKICTFKIQTLPKS